MTFARRNGRRPGRCDDKIIAASARNPFSSAHYGERADATTKRKATSAAREHISSLQIRSAAAAAFQGSVPDTAATAAVRRMSLRIPTPTADLVDLVEIALAATAVAVARQADFL